MIHLHWRIGSQSSWKWRESFSQTCMTQSLEGYCRFETMKNSNANNMVDFLGQYHDNRKWAHMRIVNMDNTKKLFRLIICEIWWNMILIVPCFSDGIEFLVEIGDDGALVFFSFLSSDWLGRLSIVSRYLADCGIQSAYLETFYRRLYVGRLDRRASWFILEAESMEYDCPVWSWSSNHDHVRPDIFFQDTSGNIGVLGFLSAFLDT